MGDHEEDDPVELPGDGFRKQMYLLGLESERRAKMIQQTSVFQDLARASLTINRISEGIFKNGMPPATLSAVPSVAAGLNISAAVSLQSRDAALKRKWKREFDGRGSSIGHNEQGGGPPVNLAGPTGVRAGSANVSADGDGKKALAVERAAVLASYREATGHSNKTIYEAATAAGMHSCYKQKFYEWLRGELPSSSQTAQSLARFLADRPTFDLRAIRRSRKRR